MSHRSRGPAALAQMNLENRKELAKKFGDFGIPLEVANEIVERFSSKELPHIAQALDKALKVLAEEERRLREERTHAMAGGGRLPP